MSSLMPRRVGVGVARGRSPLGASIFVDRFVLPRWARRPARLLARLGHGDFEAPRHAATILSLALLSSSAAYGAYLGGHMDGFIQGVTARTGFAVDQIKVVGNRQTSEIDVLDKLGLDGWTSLIGFDAGAARDRIDQLPWIETAAVRKIYPHTLEVNVDERNAFAIWQQGSELSVIERDGRIIAPYAGGREESLPLIIGPGAPDEAPKLLSELAKYPSLAGRVKGYVRVGERRWNLALDNGVTVKLPEEGEADALAELVKMDKQDGLLSRDILSIDMRIGDRIAIELSPDAQKTLQASLGGKSRFPILKPEHKI